MTNTRTMRTLLMLIAVAAGLTNVQGPATAQVRTEWHHHLGGVPLQRATRLIDTPQVGDTVSNRVSGVWSNRANLNLWEAWNGAYFNATACRVHGYIDEANQAQVPRYKFVGMEWQADTQAVAAMPLVRGAFSEWSSLSLEAAAAGDSLRTGLEFREVAPNLRAEIELRWAPLKAAAEINRGVNPDGSVGLTTLTFNSSTHWAFGLSAATRRAEMHFYSTALHEVGHIVGLWESRDRASIMIFERDTGPNGPSFDRVDDASRRATLALYTRRIDPQSGASETCFETGPAPKTRGIQRHTLIH